MQLELESLRVEQETGRSGEEREESNQAEGSRSPDMPHFVNGKDNIHTYLIQFERYATVANWPQLIGQLS